MLGSAHVVPLTPFEKWIHDILPGLFTLYGLRSYSVSYGTVSESQHSQDRGVMLEISFQKEYHSIFLKIHPIAYSMWQNKEYDEILDALIHEVAHIIIGPISDLAMERYVSKREIHAANEEATESIAQVARKLLRYTNPELFKVNKAKK